MPKYLHHHKVVNMPPQMAQQVVADIRAGRTNQFGTKPLNAFIAKDEMWCYSEAPNADTVCKLHEAVGLKLDKANVIEVTSLV